MLGNELGHLKHRDLRFAGEHSLQIGVAVDIPSVLLVLQIVLLDVLPKFLDDLSSRKRLGTHHFRQCVTGL